MVTVFFLIYFAVLRLVFELKQSLEGQPYSETNSLTIKKGGITMEYGALWEK